MLARLIRGASDRRLERTLGRPLALRALFGAMVRRFDPEAAAGFAGEIQYDLRFTSGEVVAWTVEVGDGRACARRGVAGAPALTVAVGLGDFMRVAAREARADRLLLDGRLELTGDWTVASRLGPMFGRGAAAA